MSSSGLFDRIPEECIRLSFMFCDIPSLGKIPQTGRNMISQYACDDDTWSKLVEKRFRFSTKKSRPVSHGGYSWKQAFFHMSHNDRIPRSRFTGSQKVVFAKGKSNQRRCRDKSSPVRLWVLLGHTENCRTRSVQPCERSRDEQSGSNEHNNERFVELYLCLQNVKSGAGDVNVDVLESTLALMTNTGNAYDPLTSQVQQNGSSLRPKVLFHDTDGGLFDSDLTNGIKLRPFDMAIVSVHFPCASDVFETDFLARALSVHVPVYSSGKTANDDNSHTEASAFFIPESDVWNYYMELPGNFLTLVDRFHMAIA
jgi:hypothetical protein